jgi:hypothetical protein
MIASKQAWFIRQTHIRQTHTKETEKNPQEFIIAVNQKMESRCTLFWPLRRLFDWPTLIHANVI